MAASDENPDADRLARLGQKVHRKAGDEPARIAAELARLPVQDDRTPEEI
jgi:hypothetical protein